MGDGLESIQEAAAVIAKHHANGDVDSPLVHFEIEEITNTIKAEQEAYAGTSYADMLKTKGDRWRLLIPVSLGVFNQWSENGIVSYYLALVPQTVGITSVTPRRSSSHTCRSVISSGLRCGSMR